MSLMTSSPSFRFINYSGTYMLRLQKAEDLEALPQLEEPFWIATSAPCHQLRCDPVFLNFLDHDLDGRILSRDLRRVHRWYTQRLSNLQGVTEGKDVLELSDLSATPEADALRTAAERILANIGMPDSRTITLAQIRNHTSYRESGKRNGDGVITPESIADDPELATFVSDIIDSIGSDSDTNGEKGVTAERLASFLKQATELLAWRARAEESSDDDVSLFPLDEATASCFGELVKIRPVMEHYFRLCRLEMVNDMLSRETPVMKIPVETMEDPAAIDSMLHKAPIARPIARQALPLAGIINPEFSAQLKSFITRVAMPVLGEDWDAQEVTLAQWQAINHAFAVYEEWQLAKTGGDVEKLGPDKLKSYTSGDFAARLQELIDEDVQVGKELAVVKDLENLVLCQQGFLEIANNFVSFHNLYDPDQRALFEIGQLIIGGRVFNFNMKVNDINAHSKLATSAGMLLLYSEVTSSDKAETYYIVTPVTSMTLGRLGPERRGVLFDLKGREWDVRVVKIVDNPISLWNAICRPFVRLGNTIGEAFNKIVAGSEKTLMTGVTTQLGQVEKGVQSGIADAPKAASTPPPAPAPDADALPDARRSGGARDWMVSGSIAMAALGSSFAFVAQKLSQIEYPKLMLLLLTGLGVVLVPTVIIAWIRLRRRNLGGLLEASGWAINAEMRITSRLAKVLAPKPKHPAGFITQSRDISLEYMERLQRRAEVLFIDESEQDLAPGFPKKEEKAIPEDNKPPVDIVSLGSEEDVEATTAGDKPPSNSTDLTLKPPEDHLRR